VSLAAWIAAISIAKQMRHVVSFTLGRRSATAWIITVMD